MTLLPCQPDNDHIRSGLLALQAIAVLLFHQHLAGAGISP